ncbi:hypothetical protein [Emticicia sp. W12TSBA100-4]|uniref:hypothetical protein n=1 Tax=Emticicia sp. W12TSBA100-4 TaxID=3160965 RepID=UPI0033056EA6
MVHSSLHFTNLQQELLRLFAHEVEERDLMQIKDLIGNYFANRLSSMADDAWQRNQWTNQNMDDILNDPNQ